MSRRYRKKNYGAKRLAVAAIKKTKKLRRELKPEAKAYDITNQHAMDSTNGTVLDINPQVRGHDHNQYEGDQIQYRSCLIRGTIAWSDTATGPKASCRIALVKKMDSTVDDPTVMSVAAPAPDTDILKWTATADYKTLMPLNWHNKRRWKVLWTEMFIGNPDSIDQLIFKRYVKLNHKCYFGSTDSHQKKGALYVMTITNEGTNPPTFTMHSRVTYRDM